MNFAKRPKVKKAIFNILYMQQTGINFLLIFFSYILGSIPSSYLIGKMKGVDIKKEVVDGARGASLTWRKVGRIYGFLVGVMDFLKGFFAVLIADRVSGDPLIIVLAGLTAVIGHNWSLFMQFTGGRGAATTAGVFTYIVPKEFFISVLIVLIPILLILKRKNYFRMPVLKKEFKTSDFFSGVLFGILFLISTSLNGFSIISFSPIMLSGPMFLKSFTIQKNLK